MTLLQAVERAFDPHAGEEFMPVTPVRFYLAQFIDFHGNEDFISLDLTPADLHQWVVKLLSDTLPDYLYFEVLQPDDTVVRYREPMGHVYDLMELFLMIKDDNLTF